MTLDLEIWKAGREAAIIWFCDGASHLASLNLRSHLSHKGLALDPPSQSPGLRGFHYVHEAETCYLRTQGQSLAGQYVLALQQKKKKMERGNKYLLWRWHGKFTKGRELVFKTGWNEQLKAKCHTVQMVLYLKKYSFAKWKRFRGLLHNIHRVKNGTLYCALKNGTFSYHNNNKKRIWAHHFLSLTSLL